MTIAVLGGSGHVGRAVVRALLASGSNVVHQVVLMNRRVIERGVLPEPDPRLLQYVVDMSSADALAKACAPFLRDVDAAVSTMGVGSGKGPAASFRLAESSCHRPSRAPPGTAAFVERSCSEASAPTSIQRLPGWSGVPPRASSFTSRER